MSRPPAGTRKNNSAGEDAEPSPRQRGQAYPPSRQTRDSQQQARVTQAYPPDYEDADEQYTARPALHAAAFATRTCCQGSTGGSPRCRLPRSACVASVSPGRRRSVLPNEPCQPSTGQGANKARLIPTALMGPAQQGREPYPIILPHIAIGVSVAPNIPVLSAVLAAAPPPAVSGQEHGYPVMITPIPTPGDLSHTTPFPSSPVQQQAQQWSPRRERLFLTGLGSGLLLYLLALVLISVFVAPVVTLAATATLVPASKTLSTALTVTALSTGTPEQARKQVVAHLLSVSSPTQSQTMPTTGTGHAPARVGEGTVTLYNAAPYSQTVAAGTLLTGADGVEIVTDVPAVIPASNPPIEGEVTVPAHAVVIGPQGNIAPLDLNGLCCMAGISVKNTAAFHDGQDAYDYPMVTQSDIDQAAGSAPDYPYSADAGQPARAGTPERTPCRTGTVPVTGDPRSSGRGQCLPGDRQCLGHLSC